MKFFQIVFFLFITISYSQKNNTPSPEQIAIAKNLREKYSKDDVAILESQHDITFSFDKSTNKVLVNQNMSQTLINLNHVSRISWVEFYDDQSKIENIKIRNNSNKKINNDIINDEFYKDKDLFFHDARIKYFNLNFPVQGLTYTTEIEKSYKDAKYFTTKYFTEPYPIVKKTLVVKVPDWLNIELKEFNFKNFSISKEVVRNEKDKETIYTFTAENLKAFERLNDAPGKSYYYPHIMFLVKSYKNNGTEHKLFNTYHDLYGWYKSLVDQMEDNPKVFENKVKELTTNTKTPEEKIKNIYYWVQDNIRYIAFEDGIAGFKPEESNKVYENRYGDCKGMANLIKQMLKLAGFDARLTWIGTKHLAYDYSTPSLSVDNHMICTVIHNGKKYFLDGTTKFNPLGNNSEHIQGKEVLIENGSNCILEKIPLSTPDENKEIKKNTFSIENEELIGKANRFFSGESARSFYSTFNSIESSSKNESLEHFLSRSDKNFSISNIEISDLKNRENDININYDIKIKNKITALDNELYIDLEIFNEYKDLYFKDRDIDFEIDYKTNYESIIVLTIPNGYQLQKMPVELAIKENDFEVALSYKKIGNEIHYTKNFIFKKSGIKAIDFERWNAFSKKMNEFYTKQIVLIKQ
ncbi:transglutaminase-like domain-containing protein [Flavobacterium sp.]|uniref:transglutaminase-like domain-containing protein n=1 Tax=Flavobacterium sp. TaxID=239 RepID=UPI0040486CF4